MASAHSSVTASACNCIGPQDGQPLCPCQMRGVEIVEGRYVRVTDLGPVRERASEPLTKMMDKLGIPKKRQHEIHAEAEPVVKEIMKEAGL